MYYNDNNNGYKSNSLRQTVITIGWIIIIFMLIIVLLTAMNMDLFMRYFQNLGSSTTFGAFAARLGDYIVALLKHTFGLF